MFLRHCVRNNIRNTAPKTNQSAPPKNILAGCLSSDPISIQDQTHGVLGDIVSFMVFKGLNTRVLDIQFYYIFLNLVSLFTLKVSFSSLLSNKQLYTADFLGVSYFNKVQLLK